MSLNIEDLVINVPKVRTVKRCAGTANPFTISMREAEVSGDSYFFKTSAVMFCFRSLAALVIVLMVLSPLSPIVSGVYADEGLSEGADKETAGESSGGEDGSDGGGTDIDSDGPEKVSKESEAGDGSNGESEENSFDNENNVSDGDGNENEGSGEVGKETALGDEEKAGESENETRAENSSEDEKVGDEEKSAVEVEGGNRDRDVAVSEEESESVDGGGGEDVDGEEEDSKGKGEIGEKDGEDKESGDDITGEVDENGDGDSSSEDGLDGIDDGSTEGSDEEGENDSTSGDGEDGNSDNGESLEGETSDSAESDGKHGGSAGTGEEASEEESELIDRIRAEIEMEIRAELERPSELSLDRKEGELDLPSGFSLEECTLLSDKELYCVSEDHEYRERTGGRDRIVSHTDKNLIQQIVFQEQSGRTRVLTDNSVDDVEPVYNKDGKLAAWQRYLNDRWQVVVYDLDLDSEVFMTDTSFNNTSPDLSSSAVVWQGWADNGWEIFYANRLDGLWESKRLTEDEFQNVDPHIFENTVVWNSYRGGEWKMVSYSLSTGEKEVLGVSQKKTTPRFALVWDGMENGGSETLMYLDLSSRRIESFSGGKRDSDEPDSIPNPFDSEQKGVVQPHSSRPNGGEEEGEEGDGSDGDGDGDEVMELDGSDAEAGKVGKEPSDKEAETQKGDGNAEFSEEESELSDFNENKESRRTSE